MPPSTFSRHTLYRRTHHLLLRFLCLHEAAILALLVAILQTRFRSIFLGFLSICTLATAVAELCSPRGEVLWNIAAAVVQLAVSRATTHTVSVLYVWVFCTHVRRFMEVSKCKFCENLRLKTLRSKLEVFERE